MLTKYFNQRWVIFGRDTMPSVTLHGTFKIVPWKDFGYTINERDMIEKSEHYMYFTSKLFDVSILIYKNHDYFNKFIELFENTTLENQELMNMVDSLVIEKLEPSEILEFIDQFKKRSFSDGIKHAQENIRYALGINNKFY